MHTHKQNHEMLSSQDTNTKNYQTLRSDEQPARHEPHNRYIQNYQMAFKKTNIQEHAGQHERT